MAVDSAIKRASAAHTYTPLNAVLPVPDGSVGNDDQSMILKLYAGISLEDSADLTRPQRAYVARQSNKRALIDKGWAIYGKVTAA